MHVLYKYKYGVLFIPPLILLGLGSQIEIFGEAPPELRSELKIVYCIKILEQVLIPNFVIPYGRFSYVHYSYVAIFLQFEIPKVKNS